MGNSECLGSGVLRSPRRGETDARSAASRRTPSHSNLSYENTQARTAASRSPSFAPTGRQRNPSPGLPGAPRTPLYAKPSLPPRSAQVELFAPQTAPGLRSPRESLASSRSPRESQVLTAFERMES